MKKEDLKQIKEAFLETFEPFANAIQEDFNKIHHSMDGFDKRMDGFDKRMDGFDKRMDGFDKRMGGMAADISDIKVKLFHLENRVGAIENILTEHRKILHRHTAELAEIQKTLLMIKQQLGRKADRKQVEKHIIRLETRLDALELKAGLAVKKQSTLDMFQKGFTLIELLVVVSIIGLIASIVIVALGGSRADARDARRIADLGQIQTALELYYGKYGQYPESSGCVAGSGISPNTGWCNSRENLPQWIRQGSKNLSEFVIPPVDPINSGKWSDTSNGGNGHVYFYFAAGYGGPGQWYMIVMNLENKKHPMQKQDGVTAPDGTRFHYGVDSNGVITVGVCQACR